jgi:hypothetical protein
VEPSASHRPLNSRLIISVHSSSTLSSQSAESNSLYAYNCYLEWRETQLGLGNSSRRKVGRPALLELDMYLEKESGNRGFPGH